MENVQKNSKSLHPTEGHDCLVLDLCERGHQTGHGWDAVVGREESLGLLLLLVPESSLLGRQFVIMNYI